MSVHLQLRIPYVGSGVDGCLRSAQIDREELELLSADDHRRDLLLGSIRAWEMQATLEPSVA